MSESKRPRGKYKTTNWADYNASLKARGSLTVWLDKDMQWYATVSGKRGVSEFLCKRDGLQLTQIRSPNSMVNRFSAAFQSRIGMLHFWLMLRKAR